MPPVTAQPSTIDTLTTIFDNLNIKYEGLSIYKEVRDDDMNIYDVTYDFTDTVWDETALVNTVLTDYVNFCKQAYTLDGIDATEFYVFVSMTDTRGNSERQKAMVISMPKEAFDKYNWDAIKFMPGSYETIASDCTEFDIHAGIRKNVNFSKVYYKG